MIFPRRGHSMIVGKMTLLATAIGAAAVIASLALAAVVHNNGAAVSRGFAAHPIVGPNGELIGSAAHASVRSQWQQVGLPE
jgi:hypothetical protein